MELQLFLELLGRFPILIILALLVLGVLFINGWTDAPNSISTCIATKAMRPKSALIMAGIGNFVGLLLMFFISTSVANTIQNMIDFNAVDYETNIVAVKLLCSAMVAIIVFALIAWGLGIPSSETHALIGGLVGAGLGATILGNSQISINWSFAINAPLGKVVYGLFLSCIFGFVVGFIFTKLIEAICRKMQRNHTKVFFRYAQIASGGALSFVHGAQDGMQFIGIFYLIVEIAASLGKSSGMAIPEIVYQASELWYIGLLCSTIISVGTLLGGFKIIKKIAMSMTTLQPYQGFATDAASAIGIFIATVFGFPISTSQVKSFSILGVGASKGIRKVKWSTAGEMALTWVLTFPGCGLIGFLLSLLLIVIPF